MYIYNFLIKYWKWMGLEAWLLTRNNKLTAKTHMDIQMDACSLIIPSMYN